MNVQSAALEAATIRQQCKVLRMPTIAAQCGRDDRRPVESEPASLSNRDLLLWSPFLSVLPIWTGTQGPRRKGMSYTEEDWVDVDATAHCGPDD